MKSRRSRAARRHPRKSAAPSCPLHEHPAFGVTAAGLLVLAAGVVYAALATGAYQDDDIDRYYMANQLWKDPSLLLHRWGMPAALAAYAVPAKVGGFLGVQIAAAFMTAAAAWMVGRAWSRQGGTWAWVAVFLCAFQPLTWELATAAMGEPVAALLLAGALWAWYSGRRDVAVVLSGWLPLARIDGAVLTLVFVLASWRSVGWRVRFAAAAPVLLWNVLGALQTGEWIYVIQPGGQRPLNSLGPWQYVHQAVIIYGPVALALLVWALVRRAMARLMTRGGERDGSKPETSEAAAAIEAPGAATMRTPGFPALAAVLLAVHVLLLILLAWEAVPFGRSIGFLRHAVATGPALALVAMWGLDRWLRDRAIPWRAGYAVAWTGLVALFLSHQLLAHSFVVPGRTEWRWVATALVLLPTLAVGLPRAPGRNLVAGWCVLVAAAFTLFTVRPHALGPEQRAVKNAVEWLASYDLDGAVVHTNHPWFVFLTGRDRYDKRLTPPLTLEQLAAAPTGSLFIWENHYGQRLYGDVPEDVIDSYPRTRKLYEVHVGEAGTFRLKIYERTP